MNRNLKDKGGRRAGQDRRLFFYAAYLPERRSGKERRSCEDRRLKSDIAYTNGDAPDNRRMAPLEGVPPVSNWVF